MSKKRLGQTTQWVCQQGFVDIAANFVVVMVLVFALAGGGAYIVSRTTNNAVKQTTSAVTPASILPVPSPESTPIPTAQKAEIGRGTTDELQIQQLLFEGQQEEGCEYSCGSLTKKMSEAECSKMKCCYIGNTVEILSQEDCENRLREHGLAARDNGEVDCRCGDTVKRLKAEDCATMMCCLIGNTTEILSKADCLTRLKDERERILSLTPNPTARPTIKDQRLTDLEQQVIDLQAKAYALCAEPIIKKYNCFIGGTYQGRNGYCVGETAESRTRMNAELEKCR